MKLNPARLLFTLAVSPLSAHAAPDLSDMMAPGLWEMTVDMHIDGMPMSMPAQTLRQCVTQAALDENHGIPKPRTHGKIMCKMTSMDRAGDTVNWVMACSGEGDMQMNGTVTFDSREAYHSTVHMAGTMQGRQIRMTQNMRGKRISECQN